MLHPYSIVAVFHSVSEKQVLPRFRWGAGRIGTGSYDLANAEAGKPVPCLHDQLDHEVEV